MMKQMKIMASINMNKFSIFLSSLVATLILVSALWISRNFRYIATSEAIRVITGNPNPIT